MLAKALKNAILHFISPYLYLKESVLNCILLLEQLCNYVKQSQHLPLSSIMIKTTNMASIGLTTPMEAMDKGENKTTIHTKAVKGVHTKETNDMEETREQDFHKKNAMSITNQTVGLLSILLKSKRRHTRSSINMLYTHQKKKLSQNITIVSLPSIRELRELMTLQLNLTPNSLC